MRASDRDTIVAVATAPGEGAIGIIRLSGHRALEIGTTCFRATLALNELPDRHLTYGHFSVSGQDFDEVLACVMRGPRSYTGEDSVEFNCHGGPFLMRRMVESLVKAGARLAERGEFTKRAFLNGKLDLSQAEAVVDMIRAQSDLGLKSAFFQLRGGLTQRFQHLAGCLRDSLMVLEAGLDFSDDVVIDPKRIAEPAHLALDEISNLIDSYKFGKQVREGAVVALAGRPNVGKSSLMNRLLEEDRAIVTDIPGTTRDTIEERLDLDGLSVILVDTAGLRPTRDPVEVQGTMRTRRFIEQASLVLFIVDASLAPTSEDRRILQEGRTGSGMLVMNKCDLTSHSAWRSFETPLDRYHVSAKEGDGIGVLRNAMRTAIVGNADPPLEAITRERHALALQGARDGLTRALQSLHAHLPGELVAMDLRVALDALSEIVGETTSDDILERIFKTFCIGK